MVLQGIQQCVLLRLAATHAHLLHNMPVPVDAGQVQAAIPIIIHRQYVGARLQQQLSTLPTAMQAGNQKGCPAGPIPATYCCAERCCCSTWVCPWGGHFLCDSCHKGLEELI
jgi:hypothetical protein